MIRKGLIFGLLSFVTLGWAYEENILYQTRFEASEGYQEGSFLIGQQGWMGLGEDGNGIEFFEGYDLAALVGFWPPTSDIGQVSAWQPLNFDPEQTGHSYIRFSVLLEFVDSTNEKFDCFRWSAFNLKTEPLFKIDFDSFTKEISYSSDGGKTYEEVGFQFKPGGFYQMVVEMHMEKNLLRIVLNDQVILNGAPVTSTDIERTLGDIDAVWFIFEPDNPGDNFMIFDDYTVVSGDYGSIPARLSLSTTDTDPVLLTTVYGDPNQAFVLESSVNLLDWIPVTSLTANATGLAEYLIESTEAPLAFFRVRPQQ